MHRGCVLRVPTYPYAAILLHDRIILNWHVILHCIWFWYATTKNNWSFQTIMTRRQNCLLGCMLVALIPYSAISLVYAAELKTFFTTFCTHPHNLVLSDGLICQGFVHQKSYWTFFETFTECMVSKFRNLVIIPNFWRYCSFFFHFSKIWKNNAAKNPELWPNSRMLRPDLTV